MSKQNDGLSADTGEGAPPARSRSPWAHSRQEAEVEDIVRALRGYRVLTRARLQDVCGASHWSDSGFSHALVRAVSTGRVRKLDDDLYEIAEPSVERPDHAFGGRGGRSVAAVLQQLRRDKERRAAR